MKIKLPILFNTDESDKQKAITGECNYDLSTVRTTTFYRIDAIAPSDEKGYTVIYLGSDEFICKLPVAEVEKIIDGVFEYSKS